MHSWNSWKSYVHHNHGCRDNRNSFPYVILVKLALYRVPIVLMTFLNAQKSLDHSFVQGKNVYYLPVGIIITDMYV
jgi:hypothetical protein